MSNVALDAVPVTKAVFYRFLGPKNVHQTCISGWDRDHGYLYEWKLPDRTLLGWSYGGKGWGGEENGSRYWFSSEFHRSIRAEIEIFTENLTLGAPA